MREALAARIAGGHLKPGDRLPSERDLQAEFDCARSVIRQALSALTRDGWVMSVYPKGYLVLGPRIPWVSRLRLLTDEPWVVVIEDVREATADDETAEGLEIEPGDPVIERESSLQGERTGDTWGLGRVAYASLGLSETGRATLLQPGEITYDHLESAVDRRIVGYRERLRARPPSELERKRLALPRVTPVLEMWRIARSTTKPVSAFRFVANPRRLEADYLIDT